MARICQEKTGLFPSPAEITFTCGCPDWASMCKHVAAVLYGIGARLDEKPDLLFALRKVDHQDLIARAGKDLSQTGKGPKAGKVLDTDLSEMFGIEMAQPPKPRAGKPQAAKARATPIRKSRRCPWNGACPAAAGRTSAISAAKRAAVGRRIRRNAGGPGGVKTRCQLRRERRVWSGAKMGQLCLEAA
jgi:hypothetical protein